MTIRVTDALHEIQIIEVLDRTIPNAPVIGSKHEE